MPSSTAARTTAASRQKLKSSRVIEINFINLAGVEKADSIHQLLRKTPTHFTPAACCELAGRFLRRSPCRHQPCLLSTLLTDAHCLVTGDNIHCVFDLIGLEACQPRQGSCWRLTPSEPSASLLSCIAAASLLGGGRHCHTLQTLQRKAELLSAGG